MRINNKGDIVPSKIINNTNYKKSYHWNYTESSIHTTYAGGWAAISSRCGLLFLNASYIASGAWTFCGFAKVTILDT